MRRYALGRSPMAMIQAGYACLVLPLLGLLNNMKSQSEIFQPLSRIGMQQIGSRKLASRGIIPLVLQLLQYKQLPFSGRTHFEKHQLLPGCPTSQLSFWHFWGNDSVSRKSTCQKCIPTRIDLLRTVVSC